MARTASNVITKLSADTTNFEQGMKRARKQSEHFGNTSKKVNTQMRFMRGGLGQVGHQVQDIAVQLQMGQNAMLVFGQQGSQIASLFGPGGAMIGAVVAIGAALSMSLAPSFFGATEAAKELKNANQDLLGSFDDLTPAQQAYARLLGTRKLKEYDAELKKLNNTSREQLTMVRTGAFGQVIGTKELETTEEYNERIAKLDSDTAFYTAAKKALKEQIDGTTTAFTKQEASLKKQIDTFGKSAHAIRVYGIEADLANKKIEQGEADKLKAQSLTLYNLEKNAERQKELDAERKKAQKDIAKEADKAFKEQERTAQRFADTIGRGFTQAITGAMSFKDAMKNVAASVINDLTAMIVKKMITDQIFGIITGAMDGGSNGASQISKTQPSSTVNSKIGRHAYEGGGFTGFGARSGGVDGKGGFLSILHPNETVIDHTKPQKDLQDKINRDFNVPAMIKKLPSFEGGGYTGGAMPNNSVTNNIDNSTNASRSFISSFEKINNDNRNLARSFESTRNDNRNLARSFESTRNDNRSTQNIENNEQQVIVNQTINVTTGVQQTVRAEIQNMMPQIQNATKAAVADSRMRGGSYSKAIRGA